MKTLPTKCPSCSSQLLVQSLICEQCETEIRGRYELPVLASLSVDEQAFVLHFMKASGSLKEMARLLGLSYPTVRNRLDEIIENLELSENKNSKRKVK
ncbi:MAG: DUF2089 family protein [Phycisphaerae bacterium]|jgi:hypothetical protein